MHINLKELYKLLESGDLTEDQKQIILNEIRMIESNRQSISEPDYLNHRFDLYKYSDLHVLQKIPPPHRDLITSMKTLEELLEWDHQREKDGFPRKIRLGKYIKPGTGKSGKVVVVPTTTESKFYHDDSITEEGDEGSTGGSGEGEEGDVIGEQQAQPQQGEGEGQGAGEGDSSDHEEGQKAFDLGKILTEKFKLPNIKNKGKKRSFSKYIYDLTDRNRGFGQLLDKKATLRRIVQTNILLGNISEAQDFDSEKLIISPKDEVYRILSKEKDFETQAVVFFVRDYSGSMQGDPTELVTTQHLLIYSWLMYQYQNNVETRFILHDTEAKEVADFHKYYTLMVAGGTKVAPAFKLVNKIIDTEQLLKDYNIYVFYGTDGDDWDSDGKELTEEINKLILKANRTGITIAKNSWTPESKKTTVENTLEKSGLLKSKPELIRLDSLVAAGFTEERVIEGIKKLVSE
ncbi:MAG: DUF444 family protein [Marinilabiliales bacterium]